MARGPRRNLRPRLPGYLRAAARVVATLALPALAVGCAPRAGAAPAPADASAPARSDPKDCRRVSSTRDRGPQLINRGEIKAAIQALYPPQLVQTGVTGESRVRFVVDCDGTVRPGSIQVVSATLDAFRAPSAEVVSKMRFRPGRVAGSIVPVETGMPIIWTLIRGPKPAVEQGP